MQLFRPLVISTSVLYLSACATVETLEGTDVTLPLANTPALCENELAEIRADHLAARVNDCEVTASLLTFTIQPEAKTDPQGVKINNSAWYGFRVDPKSTADVRIRLQYENGKHRYRPKTSFDGVNWTALSLIHI